MSYIILPSRRTRQPQGAVRVDWSNPLSLGLKATWCFSQPNEIIGGTPIVPGEAVYDVGVGGRGLTNYIYGNDCPILASDSSTVLPTGPCTIVIYSKWLDGASALLSAGDPAETTSECHIFAPYFGRLYWRYGNGTGIDVAYTGGGDDVVAVTAGGALGRQIWVNGNLLLADSSTITRTQTSAGFGLGYPVLGRRNGERRYCLHIFHRQFSAGEMAEIGRNPWQIYRGDPRRLYFGAGATGGAETTWTYTPSGGIALGGSANLLRGKIYAPSGGVALAGLAVTDGKHNYAYAPGGGLTIAGAAALLRSKVYTTAGGVTIAGAADLLKGKIYGPSGGMTLAGAATTSYNVAGATSYPYQPTGGIALAGTATTTATKFYVAPVSGGIVIAGTAASSFTSTAATDFEYLPSGGFALAGEALYQGPDSGLGGTPIRRRKRYLIRDRVYDDLDPADVIAAAKGAGVDLGDVREVTKERAKPVAKPRRADDDGREYWLPQEFWGRAAAQQRAQATSPLTADFYRAVEALRAPQGTMRGLTGLRRRRQEEEAILLLTA